MSEPLVVILAFTFGVITSAGGYLYGNMLMGKVIFDLGDHLQKIGNQL